MCLGAVPLFMLLVGENLIGEVVVLVNEEINFLTRFFALGAKIVYLVDGIFLLVEAFFGTFW